MSNHWFVICPKGHQQQEPIRPTLATGPEGPKALLQCTDCHGRETLILQPSGTLPQAQTEADQEAAAQAIDGLKRLYDYLSQSPVGEEEDLIALSFAIDALDRITERADEDSDPEW